MEKAITLQRELKKKEAFDSLEEEVFLNLWRTYGVLMGLHAAALKDSGLTPAHYNILRILRGAREPLPCFEVADRMVTREPDITRLLDRLENQGLVSRSRSLNDRRVVEVAITGGALELLRRLDPLVRGDHKKLLGHLSQKDLSSLNRLLSKCRMRPEA